MQTIGITGGTGFVGKHLTSLLTGKGLQVIIFTRNPQNRATSGPVSYAYWDAEQGKCDTNALAKTDAIVHLAGAGVADKRWTKTRKKEIIDSRVKATDFLVGQLKEHAPQCKTFIAASAIGFYGPDIPGKDPFAESAPPYNDFLGTTCKAWETSSTSAEKVMRTVILRFGIVLGKESGAFPQFAKPTDMGIVPLLGGGKQTISWIEVDDLARMILYSLEHSQVNGVYNAVAPNPVTQKALMQSIAREKGGIKIPVPVPSFVLKIMLGEMSIEVLKSCTVSAQKVLDAGFVFDHPTIGNAVKYILAK